MELKNIKDKVKQIIAKNFKIDIKKLNSDSSPNEISEWDSLNHIRLIILIEKEFKIKFDESEVVSLVNIGIISKTIYSYL